MLHIVKLAEHRFPHHAPRIVQTLLAASMLALIAGVALMVN